MNQMIKTRMKIAVRNRRVKKAKTPFYMNGENIAIT